MYLRRYQLRFTSREIKRSKFLQNNKTQQENQVKPVEHNHSNHSNLSLRYNTGKYITPSLTIDHHVRSTKSLPPKIIKKGNTRQAMVDTAWPAAAPACYTPLGPVKFNIQ